MKILLDHNLDRRLKQYLTDHDTATTQEQGWAGVLNGELLSLAEQNGFQVLLTADSNIKSQQNITGPAGSQSWSCVRLTTVLSLTRKWWIRSTWLYP